MIALDTNILIHARRTEMPHNDTASFVLSTGRCVVRARSQWSGVRLSNRWLPYCINVPCS